MRRPKRPWIEQNTVLTLMSQWVGSKAANPEGNLSFIHCEPHLHLTWDCAQELRSAVHLFPSNEPATLRGGQKHSWSQAAQSQRSSWSLWPGGCCCCCYFWAPGPWPARTSPGQLGLLGAWQGLRVASEVPAASPTEEFCLQLSLPLPRLSFPEGFISFTQFIVFLSASAPWPWKAFSFSYMEHFGFGSRCVGAESLSHAQLCDPMDHSPPGSSVHGILQARRLEWVAIPFSRGSSWPRDRTQVSCITGRFFIVWATWEAMKENFQTKMRQTSGCNLKKTSQFWDRLICSRSVSLGTTVTHRAPSGLVVRPQINF